ncbi:E2/UBC family protein [Gilvimarinus algae]|uniref:E2/UBC family protein n=1 Tax=Gilvimarinus algae TaxID=3058037 RepID=A0ABT8TEC8_9GAMM|nr:E2/UBC family protein [Gilvimarinus sp. SDUM040014]MDO3382398.1 E2/UBC family protein [Gilvimarinus sp. SDUM040014]
MSAKLHKILLTCGFRYVFSRDFPKNAFFYKKGLWEEGHYSKKYKTDGGDFSVALLFKGDPHIELPHAILTEIPDQYTGRLVPHINYGLGLCYVEEMEADWNPNNLAGLYRQVDKQIQKTLNCAVKAVNNGLADEIELEGEFSAYWEPTGKLYLLCNVNESIHVSMHLLHMKKSELRVDQFLTYDKNDRATPAKWLACQGYTVDEVDMMHADTHFIKCSPSKLAGVEWPPGNLKYLVRWLSEVDQKARNQLVTMLVETSSEKNVVILDVSNQGLLAFSVEISRGIIKKWKARKGKSKAFKIIEASSRLTSPLTSRNFQRLKVIDASRDALLSRNIKKDNRITLSEKRIALIGCGTIGGYLAGLLLRNSAGCGENSLHLYDKDTLSPHNFSRHSLPSNYFNSNKATALAANLVNSTYIANQESIKGFPENFPINNKKLEEYDIIIDATGRGPVSKRLAHIARTLDLSKRPILIHAFNDGNGRASKVFVDDGRCCYGCLVSDPKTYSNENDIRFGAIDISAERVAVCGGTYTPYSAAVSHITAALALQSILNLLDNEIDWNYSECMLNGDQSKQPLILTANPRCRICGTERLKATNDSA